MNMSISKGGNASDQYNLLGYISQQLKNKTAQLTQSEISQIFRPTASLAYSPDLESLKGWLFENSSQYKLALYIYDEVLLRFPLHSPTLRRKASILNKIDRQSESQRLFQIAEMLEPENLYIKILNEDDSKHSEQVKNSQLLQENLNTDKQCCPEQSSIKLQNQSCKQQHQQKQALDIQIDEKQSENQNTPHKKWNIQINKVKIDGTMIKKQKSVMFMSQGCLQVMKDEPKRTITKKKSILKVISIQNANALDKYDENKVVQCFINTDKLDKRKMEGKYISSHKQSVKQIGFQINNSTKDLHTPNDFPKISKRKSSLLSSSKISFRS